MRLDRWIQVIARYVGMVLSAGALWVFERAGQDLPADAQLLIDNVGLAIGGLIVGVVGMLLDPVIHWINNGGLMAAPKMGGAVSPKDAPNLP